MTNPTTLMDRLLQEAEQAGTSREHVLDQVHYASLNVEEVMAEKFDKLIEGVQAEWGDPDQNLQVQRSDNKKVPLPKWLHETTNVASSTKLIKVAYWKRESGFSYVALRVDVDSKDRPNYYNLVIGSRRRQSSGVKIEKLRQKRPWWAFFKPGNY